MCLLLNLEEEDSGIGIFEIHLKFKFGTSGRLDFNVSQVAQVFDVLRKLKIHFRNFQKTPQRLDLHRHLAHALLEQK